MPQFASTELWFKSFPFTMEYMLTKDGVYMAAKLKLFTRTLVALAAVVLLSACTGMPQSVKPVTPFSVDNYLGTWYEIARLDHSFERGLSDVSAVYSLNDDGSIKVTNRGFDTKGQEWQQADGRAVFVDDENKGHLKVSFFGPFYSSYVCSSSNPTIPLPLSAALTPTISGC